MYNERLHSKELLDSFSKSVQKLLDDLDARYDGLKKNNESERTADHWTQKMMAEWFNKHGGLPI